jgi:hypothetical protein
MSTRMRRLQRVVAVLGLALVLLQAGLGTGIPGPAQAAGGAALGVQGGCGDGTCGYVVK